MKTKNLLCLFLLIFAAMGAYGSNHLPSINEQLEHQNHPYTGVIYHRITTQRTPGGEDFTIVVPKFDAIFEAILPDELLLSSDDQHKRYMNKLLKAALKDNRKLRKKFTKQQLSHIVSERVPLGYVWHHDAPLGKMQLVDKVIHDATPHTGGRWIWGGGTSNRS